MINFDTYYPAHSSRPVRIHGASDHPLRVHEAEPDEDITGLDIWDNSELSALDQWRKWFEESGNAAAWAKVDCIECELGRHCSKTPMCSEACATCGYRDCECER